MNMSNVELGFLEVCEPWQVESRLFPSKAGRKPAWLDLENVPTYEQLLCKKCQRTMIFLCQIYAPHEPDVDNYEENFHRTLFAFVCRNSDCCQRNSSDNFKVFRSSLRRKNKFYPYDPPEEKPSAFSIKKLVNLCNLCGCGAQKQCSKCKNVQYCSKDHQIIDWKEGHKKECNASVADRLSKVLFPEFEIVTEPEEVEISAVNEDAEIEKFKQLELDGKAGVINVASETELDMHATADKDKTFSKFKKRTSRNPDQILRYHRGGQPLWIAKEPLPVTIPNCEYCGSERTFEFQIMPQLLSELKENDLDWGVIAVYTCVKSCTNDANYKEEFVFKQDVELDGTI